MQYESDDTVENINMVSYRQKIFEKLWNSTINIVELWKVTCPFDGFRGYWKITIDHAIHESKHGKGNRTRANHTALLKHMRYKEPETDVSHVKSRKEVSHKNPNSSRVYIMLF